MDQFDTRSSLAETQEALQALGDAVTADDVRAYRTALRRAWHAGLTDEQVADAWTYRGRLRDRLRDRSGRSVVSFDHAGCIR